MEGYRQQINRLMELSAYFTRRIKSTEGFEMVLQEPQYLNICFWYVPPSMRLLSHEKKMAKLGPVREEFSLRSSTTTFN